MGTSYETMLAVADFPAVVQTVTATGEAAIVIPVAGERIAIVPREEAYGVAELDPLATALSARLGCPVLTSSVFDSVLVECHVYRDGRSVHRYLSSQDMNVERFEDDDGVFKPMIDGVVYPADHPIPTGPLGAEPAVFTPFAVGTPDLLRIGAALRGEVDHAGRPWLMAEIQHRAIMEALGLPPGPLTVAYRHLDAGRYPAAVTVSAD